MVGRGADERQAEGNVATLVEIQRLDRDQRLVVIHADRGVVAGARRGMEHGIWRQRAGHIEAFGAQALDSRGNDCGIFVAHRTGLAGMSVDPCNRQPRPLDAELVAQVGRSSPCRYRKSTRLNSIPYCASRMPSSACNITNNNTSSNVCS